MAIGSAMVLTGVAATTITWKRKAIEAGGC